MREVWQDARFGDVAVVARGLTYSATQECDEGARGATPILRIPNVQRERFQAKDIRYITGVSPVERSRYSVPNGAILMVGSNGNEDRVGNCCFIVGTDGYVFASFLMRVVPDEEQVDPKFFYYLTSGDEIQRAITAHVGGSTGLKNISLGMLRNHPLSLPPLPEQRRIAEILDTLDEAIRKTEEVIAKLEQMKQGLLHDLLTRGIDENGELRDPERHPEQFKDSPLGQIPRSWGVSDIRDLLASGTLLGVQDGNHGEAHPVRADFVREGVPFVMANNLREGAVDVASCHKITRSQYLSLRVGFARAGDLLLSHKGTIGRVAIVQDELSECMLTPQVTYYRCDHSRLAPEFLAAWFSGPTARAQMEALAAQSTRAFISITTQRELLVAVPGPGEQLRIALTLKRARAKLAGEERFISKLRTLKHGLMDDLLTGQVRVKVDEAAE